MKKKVFCIALISCLMLSLTGCKNAIPQMTEEQMSLVTGYAANLLLKYDANYQPMLLNDEELAAEEEMQKKIQEEAEKRAAEEAARQEAAEQKNVEEKVTQQEEEIVPVSIADFLGLEQVSITCNKIEFIDSYPESGDELFFAVNASEGCRLAVVHLAITNLSDSENAIDIFNKNVKFKVSFNGGEYHNTMATFIEYDFSTYAGTLPPAETIDTVLLVDLKEEECAGPDTANLYMKYQGESVKTAIY